MRHSYQNTLRLGHVEYWLTNWTHSIPKIGRDTNSSQFLDKNRNKDHAKTLLLCYT